MAVSLKVAVIGAGFSGLCAARELQREGHQVIVLEKAQRLGGGWVYDPRVDSDQLGLDPNRECIHSSLYQSLQTNLPRHILGFSDFSFEVKEYGDSRTFPGHQEVLKFLEDFAHEFKLTELIRFNTEVVRVERVESSKNPWVVESRMAGLSFEEGFQAVVVCIGHHTEPQLADNIPGIDRWPRKQIHSHNYRVSEPYRDQAVVIIGNGPSGLDISREISTIAKEVHVSSRLPNVVASKSNTYNNMWLHSEIDYVYEDGRVEFRDGFIIEADCIIHCTGYKYHFPFLKTNGIVTVEDNRVGPLYKHVFPPLLSPTLSFIGLPQVFIVPRLYELQSKWIAQVLSKKIMLPSKQEMIADVKEHYRVMEEKGIPKQQTHSLEPLTFDYLDWLAAQVGSPLVEDRLKEIYTYIWTRFLVNPERMRDEVNIEKLIM